jgi:hypothetical protein
MKKRRWPEKMIFGLGAGVIQNIAHYGASVLTVFPHSKSEYERIEKNERKTNQSRQIRQL